MSDQEAVFDISLEGNTPQYSRESGDAIDAMRERVLGAEKAIKTYSETLRKLRGKSDEVKQAKAQLQAKINGERDAISKVTVAALKSGVSLDKLNAKTTVTGSSMGDAMSQVGGPVGALQSKLSSLAQVVGNGSAASGIFRLALVGTTAAVLAVTAAAAGLLVMLARFVVSGANAARTAALFREAAAGSEANGKALGTQIEALAGKVSTSREELAGLANELARNGMRGQTLVDTFNAVGQAADAMGSEAASKIRGLVEAGRLSQRLFLNRESLVGTGVAFDEVAEQLAKSMKVGVAEARAALVEGRVGLGVGAKALRDAIEKKFAPLNARKMLDLDVQAKKFKDNLLGLTSDVKLEPLLKSVARFGMLFDDSTASGAALKKMVTIFGDTVGSVFSKAAPVGEQFFKGLIIGGLALVVSVLKLRKAFRETFGDTTIFGNVDGLTVAMKAGQYTAGSLAVVLGLVAVAVGAIGYSAVASVTAVSKLFGAFKAGVEFLQNFDWAGLGTDLVDGIVGGIERGAKKVKDAVVGLAKAAHNAFTSENEIRSPSRKYDRSAFQLPAGAARGIERGTPMVERAVDKMASVGPSGGFGGGGAGGASGGGVRRLELVVRVEGDAGPREAWKAPSVRASLLEVLRELATETGIPVT